MSRPLPDGSVRSEVMAALANVVTSDGTVPRRLGAFPMLRVLAQGGLRARRVPEEYWREASSLEGHLRAVIDCPCGNTAVVELAQFPVPCAGCQRWFFYAGSEVLALNGPAE